MDLGLLLYTKDMVGIVDGGFVFKRPDGTAVPPCGYRLDDWQDDRLSAVVHSAEVFSGVGGVG